MLIVTISTLGADGTTYKDVMLRQLIAALLGLTMLTSVRTVGAQPDIESCHYIVRYKDVRQYEKPDTASRVLSVGGWGHKALIDWKRAANAPSGWLPTDIYGRGPAQKLAGW